MKNTFVKVLSLLMALMMVAGVFGMITVSAEEECDHVPAGDPVVVKPTCTTIGYSKYQCAICNEEYIDDVKPANEGHNFVKVPAKDSTCTEKGNTEGWACADCGTGIPAGLDPNKTAPEEIKLKDHRWGTYMVKVAKTCTTNAYEAPQCLYCDNLNLAAKVEVPNTAGHDYIYVIDTPATSCITGQVTITCSACDYKDVIVQSEDHTWVDMVTKAELDAAIAADGAPAYLTEAKNRNYMAGEECCYTWKSAKYCAECFEIKDAVLLENKLHDDGAVTSITKDNLDPQLAGMTIPGTNQKFTVGSTVKVDATCTTNGWELHYCNDCQDFWIKVLAKPENGHAPGEWSAWTSTTATGVSFPNTDTAEAIQTGAYHTHVFTRTKKCTACLAVVATETTTATQHNFDNSETDKSHTIVHPVTCYDNGYIEYHCNYCTHSEDVITQVAKRYHSWEAAGATPVWVKVENYNCTTNAYLTTTCTHPECDMDLSEAGLQKAQHTPVADTGAAHDYQLDIVPGNCMVADKYQQKCTKCAHVIAYTGDKKPDGSSIKPNNHVAAYNLETNAISTYVDNDGNPQISATATTLAPKQAYSCTTDEIKYFVCACEERVELVTRKADGHNLVTGGVDETLAGAAAATAEFHVAGCTAGQTNGACVTTGNNVCKNFEPKTPNCAEAGQTAGTLCVDCGYVQTAPTPLAVNPANHHPDSKPAESLITVVPASCKDTGYRTWNCTKCFVKVREDIADDDNNVTRNENYHINMEERQEVPSSCVFAGMNAHYFCKDCGNYYTAITGSVTGATTAAANKVTAESLVKTDNAKTHTWSELIAIKYETCDDIGFAAFKFCTVCQGATTLTEEQYGTLKTVQLQDAAKTVVVDDAATNKAGQNEAYNAIVIKAHELTYTRNWSSLVKYDKDGNRIPANCTTGAWTEKVPAGAVCVYCDLHADRTVTDKWVGTEASGDKWEAPTGHDSVLTVINRVNLIEGTMDDLDCTKPSFERVMCTKCNETWLRNYNPAADQGKGHKFPEPDAEGNYDEALLGVSELVSCLQDRDIFVTCENCTQHKNVDVKKAEGHYVMNGTNKTPIDFECENLEKYAGLTCAACLLTVGQNPNDIIHNPVTDKVEATCTTDGYEVKYCKDCNETFAANTKYETAKGHDYGYGGEGQPPKFVVSETATETVYRCHKCGENYSEAKVITPDSVAVVTYAANKVVAGEQVDIVVTVSGQALTYNAAIVTLNFDSNKFDIVKATAGDAKAVAAAGDQKISIFVPNDVEGNAQTAAVAVEGTVVVTVTLQAKRYANGADYITASVIFNEGTKAQNTAEAPTVADDKKAYLTVAGLGNLNGDALFTAEDAIAIHAMIGKDYNATADVNGDGVVNMADAMAVAKYSASNKKAIDFLKMIGEYDAIEECVYALYEGGKLADMDGDRVILINDVYALLNKIDAKINADATFTYDSIEELVYDVMTNKAILA